MKEKKIFKIVGCIMVIILLVLLIIGVRKIYLKDLEEKLVDIDWLRDNVSIEKNKTLGNNIYYVNKNDAIDIYIMIIIEQ